MDTNELNAPPRAKSRVRRSATRSGGGVTHEKSRHRDRFTVVGNHLSQHPELSLIAIGLGLHIQSLPDGKNIGIKFLRVRFPEDSEARIAAGLRELEAAGYLSRDRVRLPNGRIVTHTVYRERPGAAPLEDQTPRTSRAPRAPQSPRKAPSPRPAVRLPRPVRAAAVTPPPHPGHVPPQEERPQPLPYGELPPLWAEFEDAPPPSEAEAVDTLPTPPRPRPVEAPVPPKAESKRPLPTPQTFDPERDQAARDLLVSLRADDTRLTLADRDVHQLAPGVAAWLERQVTPDAVRQALTVRLPETPANARALLAYRLAQNMPGPLPAAPVAERPDPWQDCEGPCGRPFRAPEPGHCRDCRTGDTGPGAVNEEAGHGTEHSAAEGKHPVSDDARLRRVG
ncbi:hypothetical protein [Streptomyces sp. NPDC048442]|uniref:hypothetical protein n=1 Tax=Streptomyces sp. NPDC048442 TaxID=3154823 RepID=UPI00342BD9C8